MSGTAGRFNNIVLRIIPVLRTLGHIADIRTGIEKTDGKYVEIPDRKEAIAYAIHHGEPGDVIVLAGKRL